MRRLRRIWGFLSRPEVYWRFFSLLLAIIFWLLAAGNGNWGGAERVISLTVQIQNLPADLALLEEPLPVQARIRGFLPFLDRQESRITAQIDLGEAMEGVKTYTVDVQAPAGVEVVSVIPRLISIYTEKVTAKDFHVFLALLGSATSAQIGGFSPHPPVVTVSAPRSILRRVDSVAAYVADGRLQLEKPFPVQAFDAQGKAVGLVKIEPPEIYLRQEGREE